MILGSSDAWLTIRLFHRPSKPVYHIVNWRILNEDSVWRDTFQNMFVHYDRYMMAILLIMIIWNTIWSISLSLLSAQFLWLRLVGSFAQKPYCTFFLVTVILLYMFICNTRSLDGASLSLWAAQFSWRTFFCVCCSNHLVVTKSACKRRKRPPKDEHGFYLLLVFCYTTTILQGNPNILSDQSHAMTS
jgi:hypothetical protein